MIDAHIHIEKGEYTSEYMDKIVSEAINKGLSEIWVLDHTHKFIEFKPIYQDILDNEFNRSWYLNKKLISITEYLKFIKLMHTKNYPMKIKFGLEVCYFESKENQLREILNQYHFDFLIGSVHFIDGFAFDLSIEIWKNQNVDHLYQRYYQIMESLIKSKMFTSLAHPDSIKLFNYYPSYDLTDTYYRIAKLLLKYNVQTENNSGLIRFGFSYPGLNEKLFTVFKEENVIINRASDAHKVEDVGRCFDQLEV